MNKRMNKELSDRTLADIAARVELVNSYLKTSAEAWLAIAEEFVRAKDELPSTIAYERFVNDVGFSTNVASKLHKIGSQRMFQNPRVQKHLYSAEGWTVLYELAKLDPAKIEAVVDVLESDNNVRLTRDLVLNVANNRKLDERMILIATIEAESSTLDSLTQAQMTALNKHIQEIKFLLSTHANVVSFKERAAALKTMNEAAYANSNPSFMTGGIAA